MAKEKKLLFSLTKKDFVVQSYKAPGKGGQRKNKVESAIRIIHPDSGAVACSEKERSQLQNKRIAFKRLMEHDAFKKWLRLRTAAAAANMHDVEEFIEKQVKAQMSPDNLKIEIREDNGWKEVKK